MIESLTPMILRLVGGVARAQWHMTRHNIEHLMPLLTAPLATIASMAILQYSGRTDLAGYALVASVLMSVERMTTLVASEVLVNDRWAHVFELAVASPAPYFVILATRVFVLSSLGLAGFAEGWFIIRTLFGISVSLHHPDITIVTLLATVFAATGTALIFAALFCFGRTPRTYQNAVSGPLYLLGGVLVPVTFLPDWIEPFSRLVFFYWSADLLRDSFLAAEPQNVALRLSAIIVLGVASAFIGVILLRRLLDHERREGTLGLT
jgi:ABC-2 type transport system permease protein